MSDFAKDPLAEILADPGKDTDSDEPPLLFRSADWPKFDNADEVFLGRAVEQIGEALEGIGANPEADPGVRLATTVLHALQRGTLVARALGFSIPRDCWRDEEGLRLMAACAITQSELLGGSPRGAVGHISITAESLAVMRDGLVKTATSPVEDLRPRERNTLLKILVGLAIDKFQFSPDVRNSAAKNIEDALARRGIKVSQQTIRNYLQEAVEAGLHAEGET